MAVNDDIRKRVAALLADNVSSPWQTYSYWKIAEQSRYLCVRTGPATYDYDSEVLQDTERQFIIRAVIGPVTGGYDGEYDDWADAIIEEVRAAFACRKSALLISTTYPTAPTYLQELGVSLQSDTGLTVGVHSGSANAQFLVDFTLVAPIMQDIGAN